jgi:catechol 2,3-dioxygenase-like lactoylglutathione lyase family enzyme
MHKSLLSMLAGALLFTIAGMGHAASVHDSDYVAISVPDLQQATAFFHNVLDCEEVNPAGGDESLESSRAAHDAAPVSRLLLCDSGTVVELFDADAERSSSTTAHHATDHGNEPIAFSADNVAHADRWLRREGVQVTGAPVAVITGPHAGQTVVNFVAPWGLRLQLVGRSPSQVATVP